MQRNNRESGEMKSKAILNKLRDFISESCFLVSWSSLKLYLCLQQQLLHSLQSHVGFFTAVPLFVQRKLQTLWIFFIYYVILKQPLLPSLLMTQTLRVWAATLLHNVTWAVYLCRPCQHKLLKWSNKWKIRQIFWYLWTFSQIFVTALLACTVLQDKIAEV